MASLVLGICHVCHVFFFNHPIKDPIPFQGKSTIIFQDSATKKWDTMDIEEYIKKQR